LLLKKPNLLSKTMSKRRDGASSYDEDTFQEHEMSYLSKIQLKGWSLTASKITRETEIKYVFVLAALDQVS